MILPTTRALLLRASLCFFLIVSLTITLRAQDIGRITGKVTTAGKPIESASLSLLKSTDSTLVKLAIADKSGNFVFEKIKAGYYLVKAEAIGYSSLISERFNVDAANLNVIVKDLDLKTAAATLSGVTVTASRPMIENRIDKTIINVDASPTNTGLSAYDVLQKSPGVNIDNNGNISLKGKQGVVILIDDKPAYLNGNDLTNYLKNLSSAQLDQIELMTQPSAKYDASGNSGVINIKTKKNRNIGLNGTFTTSAIIANYFKNTNSLNFNWRQGKLNFYGNVAYSHWDGFEDLSLNRNLRVDKTKTFERYVEQNSFGRYSGRPLDLKAGIDWFASKKTIIGIAANRNLQDDKFTSDSRANIFDNNHDLVQYNNAYSQTHNPWTNFGVNLNIEQKLDTSGSVLTGAADYISFRTRGNQYSYNYLYGINNELSEDPYLLQGYLPADIDIYSFKSDYKKPFKNKLTLEAGIKFSYVNSDNDARYTRFNTPANKWDVDTSRSNHFLYKENINAGYINLQKEIKKWGIQLGLRAEQTIADGDQVTRNISFRKNYTKLFPTTYFSYKLNDSNTVALSYGRRIQRPGYQQLNPFQFQIDRYTYQQGNPNLQPQFSHNIELSYNFKGQLNVSANYTTISDIINDVIISFKQPGDSNYRSYLTTQNIASSRNIGLSANYNKQLTKWWTLNVFANVYNNYFKGVIDNENISVQYTAFSSNISNQLKFNKGWTAELSGFYASKQLVSSAILASPMGEFSLGAGKQVLKNKGSIKININDPFYLMSFRGVTDLNKGVTYINSRWDNRRYILTLTYRFGKSLDQQNRKRSSAADDEKNRINSGGRQ